jgi:Spy/CpxP family protein refolding chaperone
MNVSRFFLAGAAVLLMAVPAFAQIQIEVQPIQIRPGLGGIPTDAPLLTPAALEKLKLTADQKEKYGKIEGDYKDKTKAAQDTYRTAIQGNRDREKIKEAQDKLQADSKKAREDSLAKVEPILTGDQKTVFAQVKNEQPNTGAVRPQPIGGSGINPVLPPAIQNRLQLTDEQKKQIDAIQKEVEAKIMKVLTDEQKKQLEQIKRPIIKPLPIQPKVIQPKKIIPRVLPVDPVPPARIDPAVPPVDPTLPARKD